jgi:hypothetical protein
MSKEGKTEGRKKHTQGSKGVGKEGRKERRKEGKKVEHKQGRKGTPVRPK